LQHVALLSLLVELTRKTNFAGIFFGLPAFGSLRSSP
jgi:hypothetical protein